MKRTVTTSMLEIACDDHGPADGWPVVLLHGFPYDVHAYDEVVPRLLEDGARVLVPSLRGYGATRFVDESTMRSGQQAALGQDLHDLIDALSLREPIVAGYDWGGRAACVVAALWPESVRGLVSVNGYNIQDIAGAMQPKPPADEYRLWYQYYFHSERGRRGLAADRRTLCALLWRLWSPTWRFDDATFERSAASFDHPDFVDVVVHSYRHRFGLAAGDPALQSLEGRLAAQPPIRVPTVTLDGADDGVMRSGGDASHATQFVGRHEHRVIDGAGHNLPQEAPAAFSDAVSTVQRWSRPGAP